MPEISLKLRPGVNVEATQTLNEAGISSCNLIRFKAGLPQKLGGWAKFYSLNVPGIPRALHAWQDLNSNDWLAVGTTTRLVVISDGSLSDITPQTLVTNPAADFSTVNGSSTVTVIDPGISNVTTLDAVSFNTPVSVGTGIVLSGVYPIDSIVSAHSYRITATQVATATVNNAGRVPVFNSTSGSAAFRVTIFAHNLAVGDTVNFPISTTVGGVAIVGTYTVNTVIDSDTFSITGSAQASSTASVFMNNSFAQLLYYLNLGPPALGAGYGLGGYGLGGFGTGVVPASQTGAPIATAGYTFDNWGEILLACPRNGGLYYWQPSGGYENASLITSGPPLNSGLFVAMPAQILVAYGSTVDLDIGVQQDPMFIRWSDQENFLEWNVTSTTQAGSFRIPKGSRIVGAIQAPQQALIFTDLAVWAMSYIAPPLVFGFNELSEGCGLIGPHAVAVMRGGVYWMGTGSFFILSGRGVQSIPCSVWDVVFQDLDPDNQDKCVAAANSAFDEMTFYYPSLSGGTGEIDKYVKFNVEENSWDYGTLTRTAWVDQSVLGQPIGATDTGIIYQHETSPDADGQPLMASFTTGYFVIAEGQDIPFVDWFFPDMKFGTFEGSPGASIQVTINVVAYPNATPRSFGPFTMTSAKTFINCRLRGRQISLTFSSNDIGSWWRLGNMRYRVAMDGRR